MPGKGGGAWEAGEKPMRGPGRHICYVHPLSGKKAKTERPLTLRFGRLNSRGWQK